MAFYGSRSPAKARGSMIWGLPYVEMEIDLEFHCKQGIPVEAAPSRRTKFVRVHTYLHTYMPTYLHTYLHTYIYTHMFICIHIYIYMSIHTCGCRSARLCSHCNKTSQRPSFHTRATDRSSTSLKAITLYIQQCQDLTSTVTRSSHTTVLRQPEP